MGFAQRLGCTCGPPRLVDGAIVVYASDDCPLHGRHEDDVPVLADPDEPDGPVL